MLFNAQIAYLFVEVNLSGITADLKKRLKNIHFPPIEIIAKLRDAGYWILDSGTTCHHFPIYVQTEAEQNGFVKQYLYGESICLFHPTAATVGVYGKQYPEKRDRFISKEGL